MKLPKTFKFKSKNKDRIYTALRLDDYCRTIVSWMDENGEEQDTRYSTDVVEHFIEKGIWKIIEEDKTSTEVLYDKLSEYLECELANLKSKKYDLPSLMLFDPQTGKENPYPSEAKQYREYHGAVAWLYYPYTGERRSASDVGSDVFGFLIKE